MGKGIPDVYLAFRFGAKWTILWAANGGTQVKNVDWCFLARLTTKFCEKNSKTLLFAWPRFRSRSRSNLVSSPSAWSIFLLPQQVLTYIVVYTYSKIKSHKKSYKIFDFKSRDSTFYKAIEKRGDVSSMQLICMTKQRKQILPPKTERYEAKINK